MPLGSSLHISASGLTAERLRLDVISNNIANASTTRTANGKDPYRRQEVVFSERGGTGSFASTLSRARGCRIVNASGEGVNVVEIKPDQRDFKRVYDPGHPDADPQGYVKMPNVEPITEMVDMISATRAYEAGVTAINSAKQMQQRALEIGRA